jgi:hypothetical protein
MKRYYLIVLTVAVFVISTGIGTALAGGSSDTSGDGYHCYGFFTLPGGTFAQFMANSSDPEELGDKAADAVAKYEGDEEGELKFLICGNSEYACVAMSADQPYDNITPCSEEVADIIAAGISMITKIFDKSTPLLFRGLSSGNPFED